MALDPIQIAVSALLFAAVFLLVWAVFRYPVPAEPPVHRRIAVALGAGARRTAFEQPLLAPLMSLLLEAARRLRLPALRRMVRRALDASGNPSGYSVEEYLAICLAAAIALGIVSAAIGVLLDLPLLLLVVLYMAGLGFAGPIMVLRSAASARLLRIAKRLPYTLDVIALMMGAGSSFTEAVEAVIRDDPAEDLNQELRIAQAEIEFGATRAHALLGMADRVPLDALRSVVGAVTQAEALGTPLAEILKGQSEMLRMHRSVRAEKLSASASLRILIPSMLILIAVVLTVFGPMIVGYWTRGSIFGG